MTKFVTYISTWIVLGFKRHNEHKEKISKTFPLDSYSSYHEP